MTFDLTSDQLLLINLLLRIAIMAGVISLVLGFKSSLSVIMKRRESVSERFRFGALLAVIFIVGVLARKHTFQGALDLSLEGTLLAGFMGGVWVGTGVGGCVGLVCYIFGETIAFPFYLFFGFLSGFLYSRLKEGNEIWNYSLNPLMIFYNFFEKLVGGKLDHHFIPFLVCISATIVRYILIDLFGAGQIFGLGPRFGVLMVVDFVSVIYTFGIALKIADNTKMEALLRDEEKQLIRSRLITLRSQINPHFLFNTLNSISALIRTNSEKAREMTGKLSSIFRKSLQDSTDIHTLSEEVDFMDDYLSIEKIRFGDEKLKVSKNIDEATKDRNVPVMILQPIVENAVKHGISQCEKGGRISITSRARGRGLEIEMENDSPGLDSTDIDSLCKRGLGLRNVIERLEIYGSGKSEFSICQSEDRKVSVKFYIPFISERGGLIED